jgi:hypothetical protein
MVAYRTPFTMSGMLLKFTSGCAGGCSGPSPPMLAVVRDRLARYTQASDSAFTFAALICFSVL